MEKKIKDKKLKTKEKSKKVVKPWLKEWWLLKNFKNSLSYFVTSLSLRGTISSEWHNEMNCSKFFSWKMRTWFWIIWILFWLFLLLYSLLIIFAPKIETVATFPWILNKEVYNLAVNLDYEIINIDDWKWNNINWIYVPINSSSNEKWQKKEVWSWKTIYYFHGNGWPIESFFDDIKYINDLWYNVIAYDYPWYWTSTSFPYKENVDNFSDKFFKYIQKEKWLKNEDLIIWWYSIWTAVAIDFASKNDFDKIILVAPLSSRYDFARDMFWFPIQIPLFINDSYISKNLAWKLENRALIIHWNKDKLIPFEEWRIIYTHYKWKKYFIEIDNWWHNEIINKYWETLRNIFKEFLEKWELNFESVKISEDTDYSSLDWLSTQTGELDDNPSSNYLFLNETEKKKIDEENKQKEFEESIDLFTDDSIQKFVNSNIPFNNMSYVPKDLVPIASKYISDLKWWSQTLRNEANIALTELWKAFYEQFNIKLWIVSAYRSYEYQKVLKSGCGDTWCAKPWYSEHQTGLVVDIFEASNEWNWRTTPSLMKYYIWLIQNTHLYGWHNTYQKWVEIDTYEVEPWHWRYLWVKLATYLYENKMTIAEYYNQKRTTNN
jgi:D-alanyl-D-alanine carboxypeptidase